MPLQKSINKVTFFEWPPPTYILSDLTFAPTLDLECYLTYILTFYVAVFVAFYLTSYARRQGSAVPTEIWSSQLSSEAARGEKEERGEGGSNPDKT